jgi:transposase
MDTGYAGQQVVGLDLHRRRTVMVRMTEAGERLEAVRFVSDPAVLAEQIAKAGPAPRVVVEATYAWYWVADVLDAAGAQLHLAHPLGVKGFAYRRVKNDFRDAADLADLLRMGRLPEAWIAPPPVRAHRELVRHRHKLRQLCSGIKAGAHAVLAKNALFISPLGYVRSGRTTPAVRVELAGGVSAAFGLPAAPDRHHRARDRRAR